MSVFEKYKLKQEYENYTEEDHKVWSILYKKQMEHLPNIANQAYLDGMKHIHFKANEIPRFDVVNREMSKLTGWNIFVVPGLVPNNEFFYLMSNRFFPCSTWLRSMAQLKYIEEPDMFHDVFGHLPMLTEPFFCNYLKEISAITLEHLGNRNIVEIMARLYWYTIEFGMIYEKNALKIYGAGIMSSAGESRYCTGNVPNHVAYDVQRIFETPYVRDRFQDTYFVIDSFEQLTDSLPKIREIINFYIKNNVEVSLSYADSYSA